MKSIKEIFQNINTLYLNKYNSAKLNNFTGFYFEHIYYEIAKKFLKFTQKKVIYSKVNILQKKRWALNLLQLIIFLHIVDIFENIRTLRAWLWARVWR